MLRKALTTAAVAAFAIGGVLVTATPAQAWDCWKNGVVCGAPNFQPSGVGAWQPDGEHLYMATHNSEIVVFYRVEGQPWRYNTLEGTGGHTDKSFPENLDFDFYVCAYRNNPSDSKGSCGETVDSHT